MQVYGLICKYVNAYASMWMLMQVCECLCKLCVCLNACLTCYASYENAYMQVQHVMQDMCMIIHMQYVMQVMCDNMQVWVKCSWVNICSYMQVDILLTHDKVLC